LRFTQPLSLFLLCAAFIPRPAAASPGMDCPLARQPYSTKTILTDLLINPATKAVLDDDAPDLIAGLTRGHGGGALPPGFASIISPQFILQSQPGAGSLTAKLNKHFAKVPLTPQAIRARCARYDRIPPVLPARIKQPAILVFQKINGFRDAASVDAASEALRAMGARRGWTMVFIDNGAVFNAQDLKRFDAVVWNNVSGDALTVPQQDAFKSWLWRGGGFAGFHGSAGDPVYVWDWYADRLIGARFSGHPMSPQFQEGRVIVADPASAITRGLGDGWTMTEEWYSFAASPRTKGAHILATLDESTYSPVGFDNKDLRMGDHPIAWTQCVGRGRSFYSAIGHLPENYSEPHSLKLLEQGIAWAAGLGETHCGRGLGESE
jgi:type 1 glutamine amidotransferase